MILSRRQAHFYTVVCLAGILPLVFLAGLIWRPSFPTVDESTDELFAVANFSSEEGTTIASEMLSVDEINIVASTTELASGNLVLILEPLQPLRFSDVLVYWTTEDASPESLNEDAILLGQLSGTSRKQLPLFARILEEQGQLIFYSLGQNSAIAAVPLPPSLFP